MSYLEKYIEDTEMINFYTENFEEDDFEEFLSYCNASGLTIDDLGEILLDFPEFLDYWNMWEDTFDF
tara:strand:+ start:852 stop:1052 length:201 start_codon:yes stop_codon:yes gene_type:complete